MKGSDCKKFLNSTYWGYLPEKLFNASKRTSWIHLFVKDKFIKNPSEAANLINRLNKNNKLQTHVTLFSFINLRVIKKVFLIGLNYISLSGRLILIRIFHCLMILI